MRHLYKNCFLLCLIGLAGCGKAVNSKASLQDSSLHVSVSDPGQVIFYQKGESRVYLAQDQDAWDAKDMFGHDNLTFFPGIPMSIEYSEGHLENLKVEFKPDERFGCDIFSYENSLIKIDPSKLPDQAMQRCDVAIDVSGVLNGANVSAHVDTLHITFSPTLRDYLIHNDLFALKMVQKLTGGKFQKIEDLALLQNEFKNNRISEIDVSESEVDPSEKYNTDSLVVFPHLQSIDLSYNSVLDLKSLDYFPSLKKLNLEHVKLSADFFEHPQQFQNLEELNLSDTSFSVAKLILLKLPKLQTLKIANMGDPSESDQNKGELRDLKILGQTFNGVKNLDISSNKAIATFDGIESFQQLESLTARDLSPFTENSFQALKKLSHLKSLDLSNNDLHDLSDEDALSLSQVTTLGSLNVSHSKVTDDFLNNYFKSISTFYSNTHLKEFIDENDFDLLGESPCEINKFTVESGSLLKDVTSLESLDIAGNSCLLSVTNRETNEKTKRLVDITEDHYIGLTTLSFLNNLTNLKSLNISRNAVQSLNELNSIPSSVKSKFLNIKEIGLAEPFDRDSCVQQENNLNLPDKVCQKLDRVLLYSAGSGNSTFIVPNGVTKIEVVGSNGANGGAASGFNGGNGGTIPNPIYGSGTFHIDCTSGTASGTVNGDSFSVVPAPSAPCAAPKLPSPFDATKLDGGFGAPTLISQFRKSPVQDEKQKEQFAKITDRDFGKTLFTPKDSGKSFYTLGGESGVGAVNPADQLPEKGGPGGTNQTAAFSAKIMSYTLDVLPGDKLEMTIGKGGKGGAYIYDASQVPIFGWGPTPPTPGKDGADGFIKIYY